MHRTGAQCFAIGEAERATDDCRALHASVEAIDRHAIAVDTGHRRRADDEGHVGPGLGTQAHLGLRGGDRANVAVIGQQAPTQSRTPGRRVPSGANEDPFACLQRRIEHDRLALEPSVTER